MVSLGANKEPNEWSRKHERKYENWRGRKVGLFSSRKRSIRRHSNKTKSLPQKEPNYNQRDIPIYGSKEFVKQS